MNELLCQNLELFRSRIKKKTFPLASPLIIISENNVRPTIIHLCYLLNFWLWTDYAFAIKIKKPGLPNRNFITS